MSWPLAVAAAVAFLAPAGTSRADVYTGPAGPSGTYSVGVNSSYGNVYDPTVGIGIVRNADGYDPIAPGTPRESWGLSAGTTAGYADPQDFGTSNITAGSLAGGTITNTLNAGSGDLLSLTQTYSFVASNVVRILETITNVSGVAQVVGFARNVDFDVAPTQFFEFTKSISAVTPVTGASYYGFESPSPLDPYAFPATPGTVYGPSDLGAGFQLSLGSLAAGASTSFYVYYGLSLFDQTPDGLTSQVQALAPGLWGQATSYSSDGDFFTASNSVTLAIGPITAVVPEPSTMAIGGLSVLALAGFGLRRRRTA